MVTCEGIFVTVLPVNFNFPVTPIGTKSRKHLRITDRIDILVHLGDWVWVTDGDVVKTSIEDKNS